jgi:hypothetical protein
MIGSAPFAMRPDTPSTLAVLRWKRTNGNTAAKGLPILGPSLVPGICGIRLTIEARRFGKLSRSLGIHCIRGFFFFAKEREGCVLTGKRFRLENPTMALDVVDGKRIAITVPIGATIKVVSGSNR